MAFFPRVAVAAAVAMALGAVVAHAQSDEVHFALASEESVDPATAEALRSSMADERSRLLVRLQADAPDQTAGSLTTSVSELTGRRLANALRRLLILQPHGQPKIVAIAPQVDPDGTRQLVLINVSAWIANGRNLGLNDGETFAILPDQEMRQAGGSPFQLDGVGYYGAVEESSIAFHRKP